MSINSRGTFAKINLSHLRHNLNFIKNKIGTSAFLCPMIKADGYGHGDVLIGRELEKIGVSAVGVVSIEEALGLRQAQIKLPILTFGVFDSSFARDVVECGLTPVISSFEQLEALRPYIKAEPLKIHLKFNTGMNRLGFDIDKVQDLKDKLDSRFVVEGLCTHFINGEDADVADGFSARQMQSFSKVEQAFSQHNPIVHYLNSAAMLVGAIKPKENILTQKQNVGCRPGISMYGISPVSKTHQYDLKPVMSIESRLELVKNIKTGEIVSYGPQWTAKRDSVIGVVPIGYADGYFRGLTNVAEMIFNGQRVPVCGIVCMDYCMIDLTDSKISPRIGDKVTVVGQEGTASVSMNELAQKLNTIPYEILTRIGKRMTRVTES